LKISVKQWFTLSVAAFAASSLSILLVPAAAGGAPFAIVLGGIIWLGLILGFVFLIPVGKQRKRDKTYKNTGGPPFLRFFKNPIAKGFDIALFVSPVLVLLFRSSVFGIFVLTFALQMHGLFNGKNYEYLCQKGFFGDPEGEGKQE
jgi:hypothetical protein